MNDGQHRPSDGGAGHGPAAPVLHPVERGSDHRGDTANGAIVTSR